MKTSKIFSLLILILFNSWSYSQEKINVILLGTGHAAMLKEFFENDENFNLTQVDEIL